MSNTLTGLIPTMYTALDQVSRELIGFIPNVSRNATADMAAKGQTVRAPVVPAISAEDITPGTNPADSGDQTIGYTDVVITKSRAAPIRWEGEEQLSVSEYGQVNIILQNQFAQALRTLTNEIETDLGGLYTKVARAYGTAGSTPFGTANNHTDFAGANQILDELGAPQSGRMLVVNSAARAKIEGVQSGLFKVNEAGTDDLLRRREMRQIHGFTVGYSAGVQSHAKGAGVGYDAAGGEPAGETDIALDGGTVNTTGIKAGDVVTFAGDDTKYVVTTGSTATSGTIVIGEPGLAATLADTVEMTIGDSYAANMFYHENALLLATRQPAMPIGGDEADDVTTITDPVTGLTFQVAIYRQYRRVKYEIGIAWGVAAPNGKHAGILLG